LSSKKKNESEHVGNLYFLSIVVVVVFRFSIPDILFVVFVTIIYSICNRTAFFPYKTIYIPNKKRQQIFKCFIFKVPKLLSKFPSKIGIYKMDDFILISDM
jgi:hypothetical protein